MAFEKRDYERWPAEARLLADKAVDAHGGRACFESTRSIRLTFGAASGMLFAVKGYPRTFGAPREFETFPHEKLTIFHDYPELGQQGRFADGDVRILNAHGDTLLESRDHRRTFDGISKYRRWDPLDALYFFGYALWHYHVLPFTLSAADFVRLRAGPQNTTGIEINFDERVQTHCRKQTVYFDSEGRIVRHDYVAEVVSSVARACHFWEDYERVGGLLIAGRRRVVARMFGKPTALVVVNVAFGRADVTHR